MKERIIDAMMDEMLKVAKHFADYGAEHAAEFTDDEVFFEVTMKEEFLDKQEGYAENIAGILGRFFEDEAEE